MLLFLYQDTQAPTLISSFTGPCTVLPAPHYTSSAPHTQPGIHGRGIVLDRGRSLVTWGLAVNFPLLLKATRDKQHIQLWQAALGTSHMIKVVLWGPRLPCTEGICACFAAPLSQHTQTLGGWRGGDGGEEQRARTACPNPVNPVSQLQHSGPDYHKPMWFIS